MKKLMFALACAASAAVMGADTLNNKADFEKFTADTTTAENLTAKDDNNDPNGSKFWAFKDESSENDASVVTAYETAPAVDNSQYLKLETNGDELQRKVKADGAATAVGNGLYIDTLVQFTATPDAPPVDAGAKLAIWLEGEDTYTLKVKGGFMDATSNDEDGVLSVSPAAEAYSLTGTYSPDTWYRLTVQAISDLADLGDSVVPGFVIKINGAVVKTTSQVYTQTALEYLCPSQIPESSTGTGDDWLSANNLALLKDGSFIPSAVVQQNFALTCVGFQGSGAIDNVTITDEDPLAEPTSVEFTITLGANVSSVTYTISDVEGETTLTATGSFDVNIGATVTVTAATPKTDWYTVALPTAVTASATEKAIEVTATEKAASDIDYKVPEGTAAETVSAALTWAKNAGQSAAAVEGAANLLNNYLLNVDDLTVDPQIEIVEIDTTTSPVKVTVKVTDAKGSTYEKTLDSTTTLNGGVQLKYQAAASLEGLDAAEKSTTIPASTGSQFIRAVVE